MPDDLPLARADREQLTYALRCLLAKALDLVPEGADLHLASRVAGSEEGGGQRLKCILRFRTPDGVFGLIPEIGEAHGAPDAQPASLEIALAREILSRQGGDLFISTTDGRETVFTVVLQTI
jgi:hypothetical protein